MPYELATSTKQVEEHLFSREHPRKLMGMDTEATSLNTRRAKLVGMSFSLAPGDGIYIPTGHRIGHNLPLEEVFPLILRKLETHKPIFYNAKYDLTIIQVATGHQIKEFGDALELVYLDDPDRKRKSLKLVAKEDLNFEMEKFESLFTDEELKAGHLDISTKSPARCTDYACADADAGLRVWENRHNIEAAYPTAVKVDHPLIDIVRKMEHNGGLELNPEYINDQIAQLEARAEALREQIHRTVGYSFEIASPKQLGTALFEKMGIPSQGMTKGKNPIHSTREELLEKLASDYPIVELIISYRKVEKARTSYFQKLQNLVRRGRKPRFSFNMFAAPTFRFAAPGGDPDLDGFTGINIQAVSNGESRDIQGVLLTPATEEDDYLSRVAAEDILVDAPTPDEEPSLMRVPEKASEPEYRSAPSALSEPESGRAPRIESEPKHERAPRLTSDPTLLPYVIETERGERVCVRETCRGCPANCKANGIDTTRRLQTKVMMVPSVRQAFRAPKGWTMVSFDYDRQELVIGANLSGEPKWIRALQNNVDLHAQTAADAAGMSLATFYTLPAADQKRKRDVAKVINFGIFFGATAYTLVIKANLSKAAAEQLFATIVNGNRTLFNWIEKVHIFARRSGYTTTYFGRRRWLKRFYEDPNPKMQAFANRSAVNTCIQGTGAEITRIAMVKTAKALSKHGYTVDQVRFVMQLHDELSFVIRDELVAEVIPIIKNAMEIKVKSWQVQLTVSAKAGRVWGLQKELKASTPVAA